MKPSSFAALFGASAVIVSLASAQLTLTALSYEQNFDALASGLPTGWTVHLGATASTLGTETNLTASATTWSSASTVFRNIASFEGGTTSDNTGAQTANTNRALGWRPINVTSQNTGARNGAVMLHIEDTLGFRDFNLRITLFTANNVAAGDQSYSAEFRVGHSGDFASIGSYNTTNPFADFELTASAAMLATWNNQNSPVYFRIRGTSTSGTTNLDTLGIDSFSLTYSAVPEPATYAAILGAMSLLGVIAHRRWRRA